MRVNPNSKARLLAALIIALALVKPAPADEFYTIPEGTIIPLRMDTPLHSEQSRDGDRFTATVSRNVDMYGRAIIPAGSKVEGRVTAVAGTRQGGMAGSIAVAFERLALPSGPSIAVDGTLTTLNVESRRRLEGGEASTGSGQRRRQEIIFVGHGVGSGAMIGILRGGGEGVVVGGDAEGQVLNDPKLLSEGGGPAEVKPGAEFGLRVERSFVVSASSTRAGGVNSPAPEHHHHQEFNPASGEFVANADSVRFAQLVLHDLGYYAGEISGETTTETRAAIRQFQQDRNLTTSGDLDLKTAQTLGVASQAGDEGVPILIDTATAKPAAGDSIDVSVGVQLQGGGWQVFTTHFVVRNTLHVYVRGVPPHESSSSAASPHQITVTYNNVPGVSRVIFHDGRREVAVVLPSGVK
ncbi:MAG TPA: peptidoglycan-binding protein [Blastocatellia bacterium]|nr:peptidoglycan-binding protein [Blastocatellia bacterium]